MHITHIDIYRYSIKMEPFVIATGTMHFAQNVLIRINTNEGIYGLGECSAFPMIVGETQETCLAMARDFAPLLNGRDPMDIEGCLDLIHAFAAHNSTIKSAFDMALYDLAAKAAGLPLYKYLGGERRPIETDITIGINTPENMAASAAEFKRQGASILKIKLGKKVNEDVERIKLIREAAGPEMLIRIDANQGWNFDDAVQALTQLEPYNIEFCEQPMRTWFDDQLPELCRRSPIPIMADESCYNHHDARRLITSKSCEAVNIKFAKSGGIAEAKRIQDIAAALHTPCMIGTMLESRLALSANVHFAYASPNIRYFDLDTCMLGQIVDPVTGGVRYNGFHCSVDDTPGIGADVDPAFLESCDSWRV